MFNDFKLFCEKHFDFKSPVNLHEPTIDEKDKYNLIKTLETGFVSSVGREITEFEERLCKFTNFSHCKCVVNGSNALLLSLIALGVKRGDEVLTQSFTFVATNNSILHSGAAPIFLDICSETLSLDHTKLELWLSENTFVKDKKCINLKTKKHIKVLIVSDIFGFTYGSSKLNELCNRYYLKIIQDGAESLGTKVNNIHTGHCAHIYITSFNGNKIITTGGGGAVFSNESQIIEEVHKLSTQYKEDHSYEFVHKKLAYNSRMPNLNASLGISQLNKINTFIEKKISIHEKYKEFFSNYEGVRIFTQESPFMPNFWLNFVLFDDIDLKNNFVHQCIKSKINVRVPWVPNHKLDYFSKYQRSDMKVTDTFYSKGVNLPSSPFLIRS